MRISFIGAGNVATHLALALRDLGHEITWVVSRTGTSAEILAKKVQAQDSKDISDAVQDSDLIIVATPDDTIEGISRELGRIEVPVVHTAGAVPMEALSHQPVHGVFYPLQSFSIGVKVDLWKVPVLLESNSVELTELMEKIAYKMSSKVRVVNSQQRKAIHLAAVISNNFTNYMYILAEEICKENDLDFDMLHALIENTTNKALAEGPERSQTGPAKRNDRNTIDDHLKMLEGKPEVKRVYELISDLITKRFNP